MQYLDGSRKTVGRIAAHSYTCRQAPCIDKSTIFSLIASSEREFQPRNRAGVINDTHEWFTALVGSSPCDRMNKIPVKYSAHYIIMLKTINIFYEYIGTFNHIHAKIKIIFMPRK